jgi:predicted AAA+ superfamily ATPase
MMMIQRDIENVVRVRLTENAAVELLGPRQVGKTTLARQIADSWPGGALYLDVEDRADRARLAGPGSYLRAHGGRLVVIDEVQRMPELFETLRGVIDDNRRAGQANGQFLLLGSASVDLVRLTESLAGRIAYLELPGITVTEAAAADIPEEVLWVRGGYPQSLLARSDAASLRWRENALRSYLERDIPMFAPRLPTATLGRLWTMLAHNSGGLYNAASLARNLGVSSPTIDRYVDLLDDLYLVRRLPPWFVNVAKRVTKAPKIHIRDSGLLHALLGLESAHDLLGHPSVGASWESFVVENIIARAGDGYRPFHYRTATGDEVDLVLERGGQPRLAIEVKRSTAPTVSAGLRRTRVDLGNPPTWIVHPDDGREPYEVDGITISGLTHFLRAFER